MPSSTRRPRASWIFAEKGRSAGHYRQTTRLDFGAASPFLNDETDKNDARLFAAIFQAQAEDFPDLLDYCRTDWEDPGSEAHWNNELLDPMICRWCDFDPQAALVWVRQHLHTMDGRPQPFGWAVETDRNKWIALVAEMARANGREGALDW